MDQHTPIKQNDNQTPQAGWHGNRSQENISPPGAPFEFLPQNHSALFSGSEKSGENSILPSVKTEQQIQEIVKSGEYRPEYGPQMYAWFCSKEKYTISYDTFTWKNGSITEKERRVPNPPPHFSEFARSIGVTKKTIEGWAKKYPEFGEYYEACVDIIQEFMVDNGVTGAYSAQFGIFAAKNLTKMRDVVVNRNENWNMKDVLDAIEKGINPDEQHDI